MSAPTPATFHHYPKAQSTFSPPLIANGNAYLGDIFSSHSLAPTTPISSGLYRLAPGAPLDYTYTYHEMKIILEGDFTISSLRSPSEETTNPEKDGEGIQSAVEGGDKGGSEREEKADGGVKKVTAGPGDVFYFEQGSRIRFETVNGGLAFYVGQTGKLEGWATGGMDGGGTDGVGALYGGLIYDTQRQRAEGAA